MRWTLGTLFALCLLLAAPLQAATRVYTGIALSGAWYQIEVPDAWRAGDAVVLFQHGFDLKPASNPPSLGPLRDVMLAEGYAVAATSYRQRGWALFTAIADNRELLDVFTQKAGAPGEIVPFGGSMGGLIALRLAETRELPPVRGAYALCPAAAGARLWDAAIDLRLAWDVVCHDAGDLPRGDEPLPWALNLDLGPDDLGDLGDDDGVARALVALNRCTGVNLPPYLRNDAMQRRLDELMAFSHITDEHFFVTNVGYAAFVLADIVRAPDKLGVRNPFTTAGVDYGSDPVIDAGIARLVADPGAAIALHAASDFRGAVGDAKVVSMHTSRDQLVIPGNEDFVRDLVPPEQRLVAIVDEDTPTHCGFSEAEGVAGWEALRTWKDGAQQPDVADLQRACTTYAASGLVDGPCRFDPDAQVTPFDAIVRPRPAATTTVPGHSTHARPSIVPPPPTAFPGRQCSAEP
jgi:pimeloyl-ACP methyl ester carboxylesterase